MLLTYTKKIGESDDKPKNVLVNIENIVKQQKNILYSFFTSRQQICNRF